MINFKWSIEKVKVTGDTKIVTHVYWRCDANDDGLSDAFAGVNELTLGDTFTAYNQLTEQQVLDWCSSVKTTVEAQLVDSIEQQRITKQSEPALPWLQIPA
jgi:hypothetical protein